MLKAYFDETYLIKDPVQVNRDGSALVAWQGAEPLTVGGELDKLASNISIGRMHLSFHYREVI